MLISANLQTQYQKFFQLNVDGYVNICTVVVDNVVQDLSRETNRVLIDFRDRVLEAVPTLRGYIGRPITDPDVVAVTGKIDTLAANSKSAFDNWFSGARLTANGADVNPFDKASGGIISYQGNYTYHTFYSSGNFTVFGGPLTDGSLFLVSGGGGGGGIDAGGGGGGGTTASQTSLTFTNGTYTVTVGKGGAGGTPTTAALPGESTIVTGGEEIIIELAAIGGCNGSSGEGLADDLACGGGGSGYSGGAQFNGGTGLNSNGGNALGGDGVGIGGGGGGGGKGGDGGNANAPSTDVNGGYGGTGVNSSGTIPYKTFRVCDGGGGGGVVGGVPQFPLGGGGRGGALRANGTDALPNSGSGGGGGGAAGAPLASGGTATKGGAGGSGFVVFAYSTPVG
jgi:hypothetical protein